MIPGTASPKRRASPDTRIAPHSIQSSRSASGMPTSSQITDMGSGFAKSRSRSTEPVGTSFSTTASALGRNSCARRAVNAGAARRRSRRWSGPSISDIVRRYGWYSSGTPGMPTKLPDVIAKRGSARNARASSCLVSAHIGMPGIASRTTGPFSRARP